MLVLERRIGQWIDIYHTGPNGIETVSIQMTKVRPGRASLAIDAPKDYTILRRELGDHLDNYPPAE